MSDDRITAFADALRSGNTAVAIERFDDFDDALDDRQAHESAVRDLARGIIARTSQNTESTRAAQQYLEAVAEAQQARLQAKQDFLLYLKGGPSGSAVADKVDAVIATSEAVRDAETTMRQNAGDIALPTDVQVLGPNVRTVPLGQSLEIEYGVANVGLRGVSDVGVDVSGFGASANPSTIDTLSGGKETTVIVSGTPKTSEETTLKVSVDDSTAQTRVVPLDKGEYVERTRKQFEEIKSDVDEAASLSRRTIGNGRNRQSDGLFSKDGLEVKLQANVENDRLTLREKVNANKKVQLQAKVNVHPKASPTQAAAAYLAVADTFLELAGRAIEAGRPSLANEILREFVSMVESANEVLNGEDSPDNGNADKSDDSEITERQRTIWAQDLSQVADLASTGLRAKA